MRALARSTSQSSPGWPGWGPSASSFALHAVLIGLLAVGWWRFTPPRPPAQTLAIEATVLTELPAQPAAAQPAAAPEPSPAPPDPAAEAAAARAAEQAAQEAAQATAEREQALAHQQAEQREQEAQRAREAEQRRAEQESRNADTQRKLEAQKEAQRAAEAQKKAEAAAKAEAQKKADAAAKAEAAARAEAQKKAEAAARAEAQQKAERDAQAREQADLRARLAAEERVNAARSGAQAQQYAALIRARVERAWIRPPSAQAGLDCEVHVTQVTGGTVTGVQIARCNGDAAVRESIEAAVYRASPLPVPENPDLFERNLVFNFRPNE